MLESQLTTPNSIDTSRQLDRTAATGSTQTLLVNVVTRNYDGSTSDSPQLGLLYIATLLRDQGHPVSVAIGDNLFPRVTDFIASTSSQPAIVGFYANSDNIFEVYRILEFIRKQYPDVRTILGGPLANVSFSTLIERNDVDFVAIGDGEYLMLELIESLNASAADFGRIDGLVWKQDGRAIVNKPRTTFRNLDELPIPDRDLYPTQNFGVRSQIVTSRGCGFRCTFCFESTNRKYRAHSAQRVVDEIKYLQDRYRTRYFSFVDDIFTTNHKRVRELCELFHAQLSPHKNFVFYCEARVDTLARFPDLIPLMQDAGLVRIQIGTESGDQSVVNAYKKQITLDDVRTAVAQCNDAEVLSVFTNFIIGGALETQESFQATSDFAIELLELAPGRLECNTTFLSPYPGTDIALRPHSYEIDILDREFVTGLSDDHIFVETLSLPKEEILELEHDFRQRFAHRMQELIPTLPLKLVLQHLEMRNHGLATRWSDHLAGDPIFRCLGRFSASRNYFGARMANGICDQSTLIPQRTFSLREVRNGQLTWSLRRRTIEFRKFEYWIIEHCSGKVSVSDIAQRAMHDWGFDQPEHTMKKSIMSYLSELASEGLVVFRKIPTRV